MTSQLFGFALCFEVFMLDACFSILVEQITVFKNVLAPTHTLGRGTWLQGIGEALAGCRLKETPPRGEVEDLHAKMIKGSKGRKMGDDDGLVPFSPASMASMVQV